MTFQTIDNIREKISKRNEKKSHIGDMMGKIKEKEEGGGGLRLPVSVALVSELSEGRGKTCQVSSASTARAQVCSSYT